MQSDVGNQWGNTVIPTARKLNKLSWLKFTMNWDISNTYKLFVTLLSLANVDCFTQGNSFIYLFYKSKLTT